MDDLEYAAQILLFLRQHQHYCELWNTSNYLNAQTIACYTNQDPEKVSQNIYDMEKNFQEYTINKHSGLYDDALVTVFNIKNSMDSSEKLADRFHLPVDIIYAVRAITEHDSYL